MPTYAFYAETYGGDLFQSEDEFNKYAKRAYFLLNVYCGWDLDQASAIERLVEIINYAVCLQADFLMINGIDTSVEGLHEGGFSVGKVRIDGSSSSATDGRWKLFLNPLAVDLLAQGGLGARHLGVAHEPFVPFPWRGW